eukprot:GHRR01037252.1.p1 GENE.GHRR01037252.1~~GHRR01037252.1.p1  ORF type:complete len:114 (+),score=20.92 GHRR01037252.1:247-588(+)
MHWLKQQAQVLAHATVRALLYSDSAILQGYLLSNCSKSYQQHYIPHIDCVLATRCRGHFRQRRFAGPVEPAGKAVQQSGFCGVRAAFESQCTGLLATTLPVLGESLCQTASHA